MSSDSEGSSVVSDRALFKRVLSALKGVFCILISIFFYRYRETESSLPIIPTCRTFLCPTRNPNPQPRRDSDWLSIVHRHRMGTDYKVGTTMIAVIQPVNDIAN